MPGFNAILFATVLYRTRLVPRVIPAMGLVGAPLLITSAVGIILGLNELGSTFSVIATVPIFFWELSVGLWMTFKGFNRNAPILASGSTDDVDGTGGGSPIVRAPAPAARPVALAMATSARFARFLPRPRRRHLLLLVGLGLSVVANAEAHAHALGPAPVIVFAIAPQLPLLLGIGQRKAPGNRARRTVPLFNATHEPIPPLAVLGLGVAGILPPLWIVGALAWLGQLVIGWGLGDGLREADGSLRPALSRWTSWPSLARLTREAAGA
jgi:hypothetical protein